MNTTPQGERTRIVLLGRCNAGKSSLINAITGQPVAIVSEVRGTTTDPVRKAMEVLPIGPVLLCDTPGLDDKSLLGEKRIEKTYEELRQADLALIVVNNNFGIQEEEKAIIREIKALAIPAIIAVNHIDTAPVTDEELAEITGTYTIPAIPVSALTGKGIESLKLAMIKALPDAAAAPIASDLAEAGDVVILVVPIDSSAPKGRLILPQQQTIRDLIDAGIIPLIMRDSELEKALTALRNPPALVITDSQVFAKVSKIIPDDIPLTSFSILFARYKGDIKALVEGAKAISNLNDGDRVLIAEGCTHHKQGDDIGTVKIPKLLTAKTGKNLIFDHCSGISYPKDLKSYALIIHCGACILNKREVQWRIHLAKEAGVPIINYGIILASLTGILDRTIKPLNL